MSFTVPAVTTSHPLGGGTALSQFIVVPFLLRALLPYLQQEELGHRRRCYKGLGGCGKALLLQVEESKGLGLTGGFYTTF